MAQYETFLKNLLAPLGVYDLSDGSVGESELSALGAALDTVAEALAYDEKEALPGTAEGEGLARREALFGRRPAAPTTALRRAALCALTSVGGDSLTLADINRTLGGCGIRARAVETDTGHIRVLFPDTAGEPEGFTRMKSIILDIIPCHLETEFYFRYLTWAECEAQNFTWASAETAEHTWHSFELAVLPEV